MGNGNEQEATLPKSCPDCGTIGPHGNYGEWHERGDVNCQTIKTLRAEVERLRDDRQTEQVLAERASIVKWLRSEDEGHAAFLANEIERGVHKQ